MSSRTWVESPMRRRVARVVVLSLVIGYSAAATLQLAPRAETIVSAKPVTASLAPLANTSAPNATKPTALAKARKAEAVNANANANTTAPQTPAPRLQPKAQPPRESIAALPTTASGHLIVNANDILLTDRNRIRVGELPFRPVKKALIEFQRTTKMPTVTLTASNEVPDTHVRVVRKFMERFYGWKVITVPTEKAGTFELEVAP